MATLAELRALAKDYGLPVMSKFKKNDLIKAIDEAHTAEFIKRLQWAQETGRFSSIRSDIENTHKKGRRRRELAQLDDEAGTAIRAKNMYRPWIRSYCSGRNRAKRLRTAEAPPTRPHPIAKRNPCTSNQKGRSETPGGLS